LHHSPHQLLAQGFGVLTAGHMLSVVASRRFSRRLDYSHGNEDDLIT
jgi:hypothetical protein